MDVTWRIETARAAACRVAIDHDFRPRVALFAAFVDRAFTRPIAGRTLATFRALAEALADDDDPNRPPTTNRSAMTDRRRIWITGIGVITAIGTGREAFRAGLRAGRSPVNRIDRFDPGRVPLAGRGAGRRLRPAGLDAAQDRPPARPVQPVRAGRRAARARRRGADARRATAGRTRSGSGSTWARRSAASPTPRSSTSATSRRASARSPRTSPWPCSAARRRPTSASRSTCAGRSCRRRTRARRAPSRSARRSGTCARGGSTRRSRAACEIPLSPLAFGAFDIIRALSAGHNDAPGTAARPFDVGRDGFVMGEGAALLVLEAAEAAEARGADPVRGAAGLRRDVRRPSHGPAAGRRDRGRPRGHHRARRRRRASRTRSTTSTRTPPRRRSGTSPRPGRSPSPWATGRPACRSAAPRRCYGHPLGASGAIEAAICALTIRDGWAPASVNLAEPDPEIAALLPGLLRDGRDGAYRRVLSTSFGFGGLNASLVFGAVGG